MDISKFVVGVWLNDYILPPLKYLMLYLPVVFSTTYMRSIKKTSCQSGP